MIELVQEHGFVHDGQTELILAAPISRLVELPRPGFAITRTLGVNGTRFSPTGRPEVYLEVDTTLETTTRMGRPGEWADVGNFTLSDGPDRADLATGLLAAAARWLDLGGVAAWSTTP